jgi:YidC/Oxa1 family membrane protein insertase
MYQNTPTPEALEAQKKAEQDQLESERSDLENSETSVVTSAADYANAHALDSTQREVLKSKVGAFAYALDADSDDETTVQTDVFDLKFNTKGGQLSEVRLRNFVDYDSLPIYLVKDKNSNFNITFGTSDNRTFNTQDLPFQSSVTKRGNNTVVSMKLKVSEIAYLEYRYELKPKDYMIDFSINSKGLSGIFNTSQPITLDWRHKGMRHAKSIAYENRYTRLTYMHSENRVEK